ncbi:hypothetical protein [Planomonospora sp. ID82291]|uniref:hypothetical protein n=1 Tax=Planomonospora sp. ID82291 TaxID=2738136 RepID=UPI0018C38EC4|nr:hypothetical protein [Planomonospora sp. ID82291]MBG0818250.1 hypothetical protein [Planomonospora sp. ID82291]
MAKAGYTALTPSTVSLTANGTKTILGAFVPAALGFGLDLKKIRIGFGGTSGAPALVGLMVGPYTTNPPPETGTAPATPVTPQQVYGRTIAPGFLAAHTWTAEPTGMTLIDSWLLTPNGGLVMYDIPLGDTPDCAPGNGFSLLVNSPIAVGVRAGFWLERC